MKRFILLAISAITMFAATAQTSPVKTYPKTIQVTGIAELEIVPDEIHVMITLKEYQPKGKSKVDIETIRKNFLGYVRKAGIADSSIKLLTLGGNSGLPWWRKKQQKDELYASASYEIVFGNSRKIDDLVNLLDDEATENFVITETTHSNIIAIQKQLRVDALKAAKAKALYLAEAISESVGSALSITEVAFPEVFGKMNSYSNMASMASMEREHADDVSKPEFKKLTLKAEMNVVFELK
jgi:uncharacterized protein